MTPKCVFVRQVPRAEAAKGNPAKLAAPTAARDGSKKAEVLGLLQRKGGATLAQIMKATLSQDVAPWMTFGCGKEIMGISSLSPATRRKYPRLEVKCKCR